MGIKNPPHPGLFIRDEIMEANALSVGQFAELLDVARPTASELLNGRADLSADMALRIEQVFGIKMSTLLAIQAAYNEARVHRESAGLKLKPYQRAFAAR